MIMAAVLIVHNAIELVWIVKIIHLIAVKNVKLIAIYLQQKHAYAIAVWFIFNDFFSYKFLF
jgi:hypothetical protein